MAEVHRRTAEVPYHGLRTKPFRENTDPAFLWLGPPYRDALGTLRAAVLQNTGVLLLTGEVGVGKTMLARALADRLAAEGVRVAKLGHVAVHPDEFRSGVARAFGVPAAAETREAFVSGFREFLRAAHALGEKVLLIVDEAQNLDAPLLDAAGDLIHLGREAGNGTVNVLNILLVAQPGIERLLRRRTLPWGGDLVGARAHLRPLDKAQVAEYVAFRLRAAGADRELFSVDAISEIASMSGGVPRLVNQICDRTLIATSPWNGCMVSAGVVRGALREAEATAVNGKRRWLRPNVVRRAVFAVSIVFVAGWIGVVLVLYHQRATSQAHESARPETSERVGAAATPPSAPASGAPAASETPATPDTTSTASTAPTGVSPASAPERSAPSTTTGATTMVGSMNPPTPPAPTTAAVPRAHPTTPSSPSSGEHAPGSSTLNVEASKPRRTPPTSARASTPGASVAAPSRTPAKERAPDTTPPSGLRSSDGSDDPTAIIDWLLQRNPAASR